VEKISRRKTWIVFPEAQRRIIALFILAGSVGFLGLTGGAAFLSRKIFTLIEPYASLVPNESQLHLSSLWNDFWVFVLVFGLCYIALLFFMGLLVSHRVAGPFYAITKQITKMVETNDFHTIAVRETDYFVKAVQPLNEAIAKRKPT